MAKAKLRPAGAASQLPSVSVSLPHPCAKGVPLGSNAPARSPGLPPAPTSSTLWRRNSGQYGQRVLGIGSTSGKKLQRVHQPGATSTCGGETAEQKTE